MGVQTDRTHGEFLNAPYVGVRPFDHHLCGKHSHLRYRGSRRRFARQLGADRDAAPFHFVEFQGDDVGLDRQNADGVVGHQHVLRFQADVGGTRLDIGQVDQDIHIPLPY